MRRECGGQEPAPGRMTPGRCCPGDLRRRARSQSRFSWARGHASERKPREAVSAARVYKPIPPWMEGPPGSAGVEMASGNRCCSGSFGRSRFRLRVDGACRGSGSLGRTHFEGGACRLGSFGQPILARGAGKICQSDVRFVCREPGSGERRQGRPRLPLGSFGLGKRGAPGSFCRAAFWGVGFVWSRGSGAGWPEVGEGGTGCQRAGLYQEYRVGDGFLNAGNRPILSGRWCLDHERLAVGPADWFVVPVLVAPLRPACGFAAQTTLDWLGDPAGAEK